MSNYRYKISFTYMHKIGKNKYDSYTYDNDSIVGCIIHSDYINNNMPIIILDVEVKSDIANIILDTNNIQNDYVVLSINKFNIEDDMEIELPYIQDSFNYYTFDQINKYASIDYSEDNPNKDILERQIRIGLIKSSSLASNSITFSGVMNNTTSQDIIQYGLNKSGLKTLVEQFDYNTKFDKVIIPPLSSLNKIIEYVNNLAVFYKTSYRFFIDFDITYLLSSSGNMVVKKGDSINSIVFDIGDITDVEHKIEGMYILKKQNLYYIPVTFNDCQLADNYINSQRFKNITAITSSGTYKSNIDLRNGDNSSNINKTIRISNDNKHMIENITSDISNSNTIVNIYKVGVDNSIFTPNKEYSIKYSNSYDESHNGNYLLQNKQEVFTRDGKYFVASVMLTLAKIGS